MNRLFRKAGPPPCALQVKVGGNAAGAAELSAGAVIRGATACSVKMQPMSATARALLPATKAA